MDATKLSEKHNVFVQKYMFVWKLPVHPTSLLSWSESLNKWCQIIPTCYEEVPVVCEPKIICCEFGS